MGSILPDKEVDVEFSKRVEDLAQKVRSGKYDFKDIVLLTLTWEKMYPDKRLSDSAANALKQLGENFKPGKIKRFFYSIKNAFTKIGLSSVASKAIEIGNKHLNSGRKEKKEEAEVKIAVRTEVTTAAARENHDDKLPDSTVDFRLLTGNDVQRNKISLNKEWTVGRFKKEVAEKTGLSIDQIAVQFENFHLKDNNILKDYDWGSSHVPKLKIVDLSSLIIEDSNPKADIQISVKALTGRTFSLDINPNWSISKLKDIIAEQEGISKDRIKLIMFGMELNDDKPCSFYGIKDESSVHLVIRG